MTKKKFTIVLLVVCIAAANNIYAAFSFFGKKNVDYTVNAEEFAKAFNSDLDKLGTENESMKTSISASAQGSVLFNLNGAVMEDAERFLLDFNLAIDSKYEALVEQMIERKLSGFYKAYIELNPDRKGIKLIKYTAPFEDGVKTASEEFVSNINSSIAASKDTEKASVGGMMSDLEDFSKYTFGNNKYSAVFAEDTCKVSVSLGFENKELKSLSLKLYDFGEDVTQGILDDLVVNVDMDSYDKDKTSFESL